MRKANGSVETWWEELVTLMSERGAGKINCGCRFGSRRPTVASGSSEPEAGAVDAEKSA